MSLILRAVTALAAPAGPKSKLSVFYFHRVLEKPDPLLPYEPDARMFDRMLGWIGSQFRVMDPLEACDRLYAGTLPSRPAVITFDDGYRDNHAVALPLLQRRRMKAAFFVATGYLGGGIMFNDRIIEAVRRCSEPSISAPAVGGEPGADLPLRTQAERQSAIDAILRRVKHLTPDERLARVEAIEKYVDGGGSAKAPITVMMTGEQVADLHRAGMRIGGHTRTHPILRVLDEASARDEIAGGRADVAAITGEAPMLFAYPNGKRGLDYGDREERLVGETGFRYAFATDSAAATAADRRFAIPRFTPWDRTRLKFSARAVLNLRRSGRAALSSSGAESARC